MAQAAIFAIHLAFIVYVHSCFPKAEAFRVVTKRFSTMFMYDVVFAAYFLFYGFAIYWTFALSTAAGVAFATDSCRVVAEGLIANGTLSTTISFCYLLLMPVSLGCALCCAFNSSTPARTSAPPSYSAAGAAARPGLMGTVAGAMASAVGAGGSGSAYRPPTAQAYPANSKQQPMV